MGTRLRSTTLPLVAFGCLLGWATTAGCGSDDDTNAGASSGASGATSGSFINPDGGASGSSGASGGTSGTSGTSGGASSGDDNTCAVTAKRAETVPIDIGLIIDTSFSMDFGDKWINLRAALKAFVNNPAYETLGLGVQFFPVRKQCSVTEYASPAVGVGLLPTVSAQITSALDAQQMELGTPMTQVLLGMTTYMQKHAAAAPSRKSILLLATDGYPDDTCTGTADGNTPNTLPNAVKAAKDALAGSPSLPTFVIGVGAELVALDEIAEAGGTSKAILVDPTKNAQEAFLAALESIRKKAVPCDYDIPSAPDGAQLDTSKVNVNYSVPDKPSETFGFVGTADQCSKAPDTGWYFDDLAKPTKIVLCPKVCERVKTDDRGQVDVLFGCNRNDVR